MNISRYRSAGGWFDSARAKGFSIPLQTCRALDQTMEKLNITFPQAYNFLVKKGKLILCEKTYILDLSVWQLLGRVKRKKRRHVKKTQRGGR